MPQIYTGHKSVFNVGYIDDSLLCEDTYYECKENIQKTVSSIEQIGFIISQSGINRFHNFGKIPRC
jgi:hypothetical protein